ncbi:hypothetical protein PV326_008460 [Microctonus aethiopoides]|nr:hypothetical protein PV326_008460 [Microctonus aethiopoides]
MDSNFPKGGIQIMTQEYEKIVNHSPNIELIDEEEVFNLLVTEEEANKALEETMKLALNQAKINYFEDAIKNRQLKREEKARYNERKLQIFEKIAESLKK